MKTTDSKKTATTKETTPRGVTKPKSNAASGLNELFEDALKDIYWAEKALTKALPVMVKNASSVELKDAIDNHLTETEEQINRLEEVFKIIGKKATAKKCDAMEGLIEDEDYMEENDEFDNPSDLKEDEYDFNETEDALEDIDDEEEDDDDDDYIEEDIDEEDNDYIEDDVQEDNDPEEYPENDPRRF